MELLQPETLDEALALKAQHPGAVPIAGGTDVLVELNFARRRPEALLDLNRVTELQRWSLANGDDATVSALARSGTVRLGSHVTYTRIIRELSELLPALAIASRTVGSPQIRNRGTVGGNLGMSSPAGDSLPALLATGTDVEVASVRGTRLIPFSSFMTGPKRNALEPDELIVAAHIPVASGPQQFSKIGSRNAMVIAVCSLALVVDADKRTVRTAIGSAGPTIIAATDAERFLEEALEGADAWHSRSPLADTDLRHFGQLVGEAACPIDDVRGSAAYRRHALSVLGRRSAAWVWDEYRESA